MLDSWLDIRVGQSQKEHWELAAFRRRLDFSKWVRDALDRQSEEDLKPKRDLSPNAND